MKRNGFTLVELLAVIAILGLIIIIVATKGFGAFNKTKNSINEIEENNLLEAAKNFLVEVDNGLYDENFNYLSSYPGIYTISSYTDSDGYDVPVSYIVEYYMNGATNNHCKGENEAGDSYYLTLKIEQDGYGNTIGYYAKKTNENDVICSN